MNASEMMAANQLTIYGAMRLLRAKICVTRTSWVDKHLVYSDGMKDLLTANLWTGQVGIQTPTVNVEPYINCVASIRDPDTKEIISTNIKMDYVMTSEDLAANDWRVFQ